MYDTAYEIPELKDYKVTPLGDVYSIKFNKVKLLKVSITKSGYGRVRISNDGKASTVSIQRIVAKTFLDDYSEDLQVNHVDGNKLNNRVSNLEMVTAKENILHSYRTGLHSQLGERNAKSKLKIQEIKLIKQLLKESNLKQETIGLLFGVNRVTICNINTGKNWGHVQ